jgi:hypothetical protein
VAETRFGLRLEYKAAGDFLVLLKDDENGNQAI